jgi:hypothetical protein
MGDNIPREVMLDGEFGHLCSNSMIGSKKLILKNQNIFWD